MNAFIETINSNPTRGHFGQFNSFPQFITPIIDALESVGTFTRGIASDKKKRGTSINVDVYGWDEAAGLIVIQVRQCIFHPRRYNRIRKDYYLCGKNESGTIFAHPIDSPARSSVAMGSPETTVRYAERQIFACTNRQLDGIVRQGDLAFIPCPIPTHAEIVTVARLTVDTDGSHLLQADAAYLTPDGRLFVRGTATLTHLKNQHSPVSVATGSWRVQVGYRAATWSFSAPTRD